MCNAHSKEHLEFCATDLCTGTFINFYFMMFTKVLVKNLARMLIHVRKFFNCRLSFKMLFSMYLIIVEKEL